MRQFVPLVMFVTGLLPFDASAQNPVDAARQGIRAMFDSQRVASTRRDRAALERVYADEFLFVHSTGGIVTRREHIDGIVGRAAPGVGALMPNLDSVRVYGDVAILRTTEELRFGTSVWVRRDGRWQMALIQGTMLPDRKAAVAVDARKLGEYIGRYERDTLFVLLSLQGDSLMVQRAMGPKTAVRPIGQDLFEDRFGATLAFTRDGAGAVMQFTYKPVNSPERVWVRRK